MSTTKTTETGIDPDVMADLEAVCNTKGIVREPELRRRVTERADRVRQEMLEEIRRAADRSRDRPRDA